VDVKEVEKGGGEQEEQVVYQSHVPVLTPPSHSGRSKTAAVAS
jgi:hypothetical protein